MIVFCLFFVEYGEVGWCFFFKEWICENFIINVVELWILMLGNFYKKNKFLVFYLYFV